MRTSPSSSSTRSTSTGLWSSRSAIGPLVVWEYGQGAADPVAARDPGVDPDPPAEVLDDLPAHREADPGARVGGPVVQALEDQENAVSILRVDTDSVIGDGKEPG